MTKRSRSALLGALACSAAVAVGLVARAESVPVSQLKQQTHIHGLAVEREDPEYLLIATHHGLFRADPGGEAERISVVQDFMGFTAHPSDPGTLYASGHPADGGNLGFIASTDGGANWKQVSAGEGGPVDFHQMTVSPADPMTVYGAFGGLQVSRDGGKTWSVAGPLPQRLIDLAASARDSDTLYAATESGLLISKDAGGTWKAVVEGSPVSLVEVTPEGAFYAFVLGKGLVHSAEEQLDLALVGADWGDRVLLHLAVDPTDEERIFVASHEGDILASEDGGANWREFGR
ncbi:exo-alpha-sialidase [Mesorhizobium sp. YIM 152430]|uniref:F510_1955 family glycosylhydrolase n=1 Tax=Mesorhizobium sp. YIM 152430 TaxID=3031761 RepID=UPI0023DA8E62|nr:exo-alpha-sialidase [Mesorhizobium sp. YIM 152430]MDF1600247.1 exo-alpha-sialidase [Mesorhizobium sp. YIM 152430]